MRTLVVTIAGDRDRIDLSVPADTPIEKLIPSLLSLDVVEANGDAGAWQLRVSGGTPLPRDKTLMQSGVLDGAVLELRQAEPEEAPPAPEPGPIPHEVVVAEQEERDLRRRAGFPLQRTAAVLPPRPKFFERLSGAISSAVRDNPREYPQPKRKADDGPIVSPLELTSQRGPGPGERARSSWRQSSYLQRVEAMVAEPRLRRCLTIAVVSPKGGVGKTTITSLLGSRLTKIRHERIVAVDTNPDYGSLGRALAPDHRVFVDDLANILEFPDLSVTELDRKLGRAFEGLRVLPAPTDPMRMAQLDKAAYAKVFTRLQQMVDGLVLDCGTGLQEPPAQAALEAADQIVLVSDADPSTASLVAEASELLKRTGLPVYLVVNKMPVRGGRLDLDAMSRAVRDARGMITIDASPASASKVNAGDFTWARADAQWSTAIAELCAVLATDWRDLELAN